MDYTFLLLNQYNKKILIFNSYIENALLFGKKHLIQRNKIILLIFCRFLILRFIMEQLDYVIKKEFVNWISLSQGELNFL